MFKRYRLPAALLLVVLAAVVVWLPWDFRGEHERAVGETAAPQVLADARGCDDGDAFACTNLAAALQSGDGTNADVQRAILLYRGACDGGLALACVNLALLAIENPDAQIAASEAARLLDSTCSAGDPVACLRLGDAVAAGSLPGFSEPQALSAWSQACNALLMPACVALGRAARDGRGMQPDLHAASARFAAACDRGHPDGCVELATMVVRGTSPGDVSLAVDQLERHCYAGDSLACSTAIESLTMTSYVHGDAPPAEVETATSARARLALVRERACTLGLSQHCTPTAAP
jgi:TPR repeat protein